MVADDYVAMQALVAAGFGVALVPDLAIRAHRDPRVVTRTLVDWPRGTSRWRSGRTCSAWSRCG